MLSHAKESILIMNENTGNLSREVEFYEKSQMDILELKNKISEIKIHHEKFTRWA